MFLGIKFEDIPIKILVKYKVKPIGIKTTTPNPTSGFLLMFPIEDVIYLNMSFEEASKFIVSAGTSNKS